MNKTVNVEILNISKNYLAIIIIIYHLILLSLQKIIKIK